MAETVAPTAASTPTTGFAVQAVSFNATSVTVGDRVRVTAIVTNEGDEVGTFLPGLRVGDDVVATQRIRLESGESGTVEFVYGFTDPGTYEIGVDSVTAGTVTVEEASSPSLTDGSSPTPGDGTTLTTNEGGLVVQDAESVYSWVRAGFNGSVRVTVVNSGDVRASRELTVRVDGERVATRTVTLAPGAREVVTVEFPATAGTVTVEGVTAGELQVGGTDEAARTTAGASSGFGPGFGPGATLLALVAALVLAGASRRRRQKRT